MTPPSFRTVAILLIVVAVCFFLVSVFTIFFSSRHVGNQYLRDVGDATLRYYQSSLDSTLNAIDDYCQVNLGNNIVASMCQTDDPLEQKNLQDEIGSKLSTLLQTYNGVYLAASIPTGHINADDVLCTIRSHCRSMAEVQILFAALVEQLGQTTYSSWHWCKLGEEFYLMNVYSYNDSYCVVVLNTEILSYLADAENNLQLFCMDNGVYISNHPEVQTALSAHAGDTLRLAEQELMVLSSPSQAGDFSVGMLLGATSSTLKTVLMRSGVFLLLFLAVICLMFSAFLHKLSGFFSTMHTACDQIAEGDLDTRITQRGQLAEEIQLYDSFNFMMQQIKDLRINLYEQELSAQRSKMDFLQVQIKSHFFVNCLNIIHSLAMVENTALIQEFALCLVDYFRYLGSGFSDTVSFGSELSHLRNYIKIHKIRYPDRVYCDYSIAAEVADFDIPPMIPQTFVENCFKHALGAEDAIHIAIQAQFGHHHDCRGMWLVIQDDGPGFTDEQLQKLNQPCDEAETSPGTGIRNTKARLELHYGKRAAVLFENAPEHGAIVRIFFPAPDGSEETVCEPF